jgi:P pilus assembly chaperone PapD
MGMPRTPSCLTVSIYETRRRETRKCAPGLLSLLYLLGVLAGAPGQPQGGPGDLLVAPTRIVFEGRQRTAQVTLVNTGSTTATYRITFVNLRMNDQGGTTEIEAADAGPDDRFAEALVRYSPRQVILEPNVGQTVRLQLRLPADLAPGEYRSHLRFRAVPTPEKAAKTAPGAKLSVQLTPIYGISIPVIVRHGETSATVTLSNLALVPATGAETPILQFQIHRTGNRSIYGNLTATFVPAVGRSSVVGIANGVAIYTPNLLRSAGISLRVPPGVTLTRGHLHLAYTLQQKDHEKIAEADLLVP